MNLFDQLVTEALKNQSDLSTLRMVVEKELLHHDILRILSQHQLLTDLTFIGGTCLRACYGGIRLSEDLDFTGGSHFTRDSLSTMGNILTETLHTKYGLSVNVSEPMKDIKNVDTWKIKVETRPQHKHFPAQRINIDICAIPSYDKRPMLLLNPYGVDMGTAGLIIQAQSREEIFTDKLLAFALRPNRIKYRDIWDILWLYQLGLKPIFELIPDKLHDRNHDLSEFIHLFNDRKKLLLENEKLQSEFKQEMRRFLPVAKMNEIIDNDNLWRIIIHLMDELERLMLKSINTSGR